MVRRVLLLLFLIIAALMSPLAIGQVAASQTTRLTGDAADAAEAAIEISRLEAEGDYDALYDLVHPDVVDEVPRWVVVGWYETEFADTPTDELTVTGVEFVDWTWGVTGESYPDTAAVSYDQPYQIDGEWTDVPGVVHLVESAGEWGWFFGIDRESVDALISTLAPPGALDDDADPAAEPGPPSFEDPLDADVDEFWQDAYDDAGIDYSSPVRIVGFATEIRTGCGSADPAETAAFYCTLDGSIYYTEWFRELVETEIGDFAWVTVVAHEWAHHIQAEQGRYATDEPHDDGGFYTIQLELEADCLAGAYAGDAEARGWLDEGDLDEALGLTALSGDAEDTHWTDPLAHGTSEQRVAAFTTGYDDGLSGCEVRLR
ncbi:MAG: neutral zinc metallopeptidase [Chloroflexia bacterium]|nr:neutral zinc metallopeptidase [Chloroflexia bacterium]